MGSSTTGNNFFSECLKHSAKLGKRGQFETDTFVDMQRSAYLHCISFEQETPNWVT
jgi:hypothetical protein